MIVRRLAELIGTERDIDWGHGQSRRLLLERDGMGFALCDTVVRAGTKSLMQYRNHLRACYCIEGRGEIEDMGGRVFSVAPGTLYALDCHDRYHLHAFTDLRVLCIFNPPITGLETHNFTSSEASSY